MKGIHCAFVGFATDAEIKPRKSKTGTEYLVLSVYRAGDETEDRELIWVRTWQNVDQLVQTVKPSCQLYIEGIVTIARWTDKHGADRSALSVNASKIEVFPVREAVVMAAAPKATKAKKAADSTPALSEQPPAAQPATPTPKAQNVVGELHEGIQP